MRADNSLKTFVLYWVTILSACTMGETAGDYLSFGLELGYGWSAVILSLILLLVLIVEARAETQSEPRYWVTVIVMSTTGTAFADFLTRTLELGYAWGSALLISVFVFIYLAERFYKSRRAARGGEGNVFDHVDDNIKSFGIPRTDSFYWVSILVASTFGTTMGDFTSDVLGLGFGGGALLLASLLLVVLVVDYRLKVANVALYWTALVIASTIGATTGDFLTKPDALNLGYGVGSLILITILAVIFFIRYRAASARRA